MMSRLASLRQSQRKGHKPEAQPKGGIMHYLIDDAEDDGDDDTSSKGDGIEEDFIQIDQQAVG